VLLRSDWSGAGGCACSFGSSVYRAGKSAVRLASSGLSVKRTDLEGLVCCAWSKSEDKEGLFGVVSVDGFLVERSEEWKVEERSEYCAFKVLIASARLRERKLGL